MSKARSVIFAYQNSKKKKTFSYQKLSRKFTENKNCKQFTCKLHKQKKICTFIKLCIIQKDAQIKVLAVIEYIYSIRCIVLLSILI